MFSLGDGCQSCRDCKQAIEHAKEEHYDVVIIDTAGRLHIDEELMQELKDIRGLKNRMKYF